MGMVYGQGHGAWGMGHGAWHMHVHVPRVHPGVGHRAVLSVCALARVGQSAPRLALPLGAISVNRLDLVRGVLRQVARELLRGGARRDEHEDGPLGDKVLKPVAEPLPLEAVVA